MIRPEESHALPGPATCTNHFLNADDPIPAYRGIPTIGALGAIPDSVERMKRLLRLPDFDPAVRQHSPEVRAHFIQTIADIFIPNSAHDRTLQTLDVMLRTGYAQRNPISAEYRRQCLSDLRLLKGGTLPPDRHLATRLLGASVLGPPGMGKTTLCDRALSHYPVSVRHLYEVNGVRMAFTQVPYLKINMFQDASLKAFGIEFFRKLAAAVDEPKLPDLMGVNRGSFNSNTAQPLLYATILKYHIGMLVVDDSQNAASSNKGFAVVFDYFIRIMNCLGLPIVLIGTSRTAQHLASDMTYARRFIGGIPQLEPLRPKAYPHDPDGAYEQFLSEVGKYNYLRSTATLEQFAVLVYQLTAGIPDLIIKLWSLTQLRLVGRQNEELTAAALTETAAELFTLVGPRVLELLGRKMDNSGIGKLQTKLTEEYQAQVLAESARVGAPPPAGGATPGTVTIATASASPPPPPVPAPHSRGKASEKNSPKFDPFQLEDFT